jgi:hypothetical protein
MGLFFVIPHGDGEITIDLAAPLAAFTSASLVALPISTAEIYSWT